MGPLLQTFLNLFSRREIHKETLDAKVRNKNFLILAESVGEDTKLENGMYRPRRELRAIDAYNFLGNYYTKKEIDDRLQSFGTTYFVAPDGDDSTGKIGDLTFPWKTISAARDQAVNDGLDASLVYVFPGTYAETEIQYGTHALPGTMYLSPGVLIQPDRQINGIALSGVTQDDNLFQVNDTVASGLPTGGLFKISGSTGNDGIYTVVSASEAGGNTNIIVAESIPDATVNGSLDTKREIIGVGYATAYPSPLTTNFSIYGQGILDQRETIDASPDWPGAAVVQSTDATSVFRGEFDTIKVQQGIPLYCSAGTMTVTAQLLHMYGSSGYCATFRDAADVTVNIQRIVNENGWAFFIRPISDSGGNYFYGRVVLNADVIESKGSNQPIACARLGLGGIVIINCAEVIAENSWAFAIIRTGLDSPTSPCRFQLNGNILVTGTGQGIYNSLCGGGSFEINGNITTQSGRIYDDVIGGNTNDNKFYINGDMNIITGASDALEAQTGTIRLNGKLQNNGVGNDGILINGTSNVVIDTLKIICDGESITAAVARDIIVNHSLVATTALNANVTNIGPGSIGVNVNVE